MFDHDAINFQVEKAPMSHCPYRDQGDEYEYNIPGHIGVLIRRKDTKEPFSIVKNGYEIVQYDEIVSHVEGALVKSGIDLSEAEFTTNVYGNGKQLELRAKFPAHEQFISRTQSDSVVPELVFRTSHDSTWANNGMMGLWRSMCWNTLVSGNKLASVYGRHTKGFDLPAFTSKIRNAAEFINGSGIKEMQDWYDTNIPRDRAIQVFSDTIAHRTDNVSRDNKPNKVILSHLMKIFDEENRHLHGKAAYESYATREAGSMWTMYNAATHWSSHISNLKGGVRSQNVRVQREHKVRKMLNSDAWNKLKIAMPVADRIK